MIKRVLGSFLLITITITVSAQDTLPNFTNKLIGNKAVLSWINTYDNITGINIQRSGDSVKNFTTIGNILNAATPINGFMDPKEFLPNDQYYRLFLTFKGGSFVFTTPQKPVFDSSAVIPPEFINQEYSDEARKANRFSPSRFVYYSVEKENVVLFLPNSAKQKYSIQFWEDDSYDDQPILEVNKLNQDHLILDKVGFGHSGLFRFKLFADGKLVEQNKLYIPKIPQRMPPLDENGYELK